MTDKDISTLAKDGKFNGKKLRGDVVSTHISWVILTRKFAFKFKRPVRFSFVDFSTPARRKKYCEREVSLNSRFSKIYYGVLPVRKKNSEWCLGKGNGKVVDYAVQMKRMDEAKRMDNMLLKKQVSREQIITLAHKVARFHARAELVDKTFSLQESRASFNDIIHIRTFAKKHFGSDYASLITQSIRWSDRFLKEHAAFFQERMDRGFVRDVHGDLHSANIFLYKDPVLYDCLEFNDSLRRIDVLSETAFLCMDLEAHQSLLLSRTFLSAYLTHFPCMETAKDRRLFLYFKCYRANVRAKVNVLASQKANTHADAHIVSVKNYLELMRRYIRQ